MIWYAAHAIVAYRPIGSPRHTGSKGDIIVYENVYLFKSASEKDLEKKALRFAKARTLEGEIIELEGKKRKASLIGIRKIITIANPVEHKNQSDRPVEGAEITYSKFSVKNEMDLAKLAAERKFRFATWSDRPSQGTEKMRHSRLCGIVIE